MDQKIVDSYYKNVTELRARSGSFDFWYEIKSKGSYDEVIPTVMFRDFHLAKLNRKDFDYQISTLEIGAGRYAYGVDLLVNKYKINPKSLVVIEQDKISVDKVKSISKDIKIINPGPSEEELISTLNLLHEKNAKFNLIIMRYIVEYIENIDAFLEGIASLMNDNSDGKHRSALCLIIQSHDEDGEFKHNLSFALEGEGSWFDLFLKHGLERYDYRPNYSEIYQGGKEFLIFLRKRAS